MNAFFTIGTENYLMSIKENYPDYDMYLLFGEGNAMLYYEGTTNVFSSGKACTIINTKDSLQKDGFMFFFYIPIQPGSEKTLQLKLNQFVDTEENYTLCKRLMLCENDTTYIILQQFPSKQAFKEWKHSPLGEIQTNMQNSPISHYKYQPFTKVYGHKKSN